MLQRDRRPVRGGADIPAGGGRIRWPFVVAAIAVGVYALWVVAWFANGHLPGDAFTYLAAGQRLNAGHDVYRLSPGDSPVLMPPPYPPYPLFSPPLIAVIFRPLAALPGDLGAWLWWACTATAGAAVVLISVRGRPAVGGLVVLALSFPLAVLTGVGNVDAFLLAGAFLLWALMSRPPPEPLGRRELAAGALVGILVSVKVIPLALAWWLLATGRWRALIAAAVAVAACALVVLVSAYPGVFAEYLTVVRDASGVVPGAASVAGLARLVGLPPGWSSVVQWVSLAVMLGAVLVLARRGLVAPAFSLACVAMAVGSPAAAAHTPALLLAALAPYAIEALRHRGNPASAEADSGSAASATP